MDININEVAKELPKVVFDYYLRFKFPNNVVDIGILDVMGKEYRAGDTLNFNGLLEKHEDDYIESLFRDIFFYINDYLGPNIEDIRNFIMLINNKQFIIINRVIECTAQIFLTLEEVPFHY